jgi:hypothetical protein
MKSNWRIAALCSRSKTASAFQDLIDGRGFKETKRSEEKGDPMRI